MMKKHYLLGIHARPPKGLTWLYIMLPVVFLIILYHIDSQMYLSENPNGKIVPSFSMMAARIGELAFTRDPRTHTYLLWTDTIASVVHRFIPGLLLAAATGLILGMNIALFPALQYLLLPIVVALSFVPMMALLPILLIVVGIGDTAKISLIFLGVVFFIARDMYSTTKEIPRELLVKARTIGASEVAMVYRIVLPMVMPRLLEVMRQSLGVAWWALIAS